MPIYKNKRTNKNNKNDKITTKKSASNKKQKERKRICYNKNKYTKFSPIGNYDKIIYQGKTNNKLVNIAYTYLTHIIKNYNKLYDIEIFLDADHINKYTSDISGQVKNCHRYKYRDFGNLDKKLTWNDIDFSIERTSKYKIHNIKYVHKYPNPNWNGWKLYSELFPNYCEYKKQLSKCDFPVIRIGAYSMFSVKKELILKHPIKTYKKLLKLFDDNIYNDSELVENYYLLEHTWKLLFTTL